MPATTARPKKVAVPLPLPAIQVVLRSANREAFGSRVPEVMVSGPSDTGKTYACLMKLHTVCSNIALAQCAMVRKTYNSLNGTVVQAYRRLIQPEQRGIKVFGGETPSRFIYPNGSQIWLAGMDEPSRALSSERDVIYVPQAEELALNDWETLATRCSGRGAVVADPQLLGDCNPGGSKHWIKERAKTGQLLLLAAVHRDNPSLYTADGQLTADGAKRLAVLEGLTGIRRKRLLEGIWATAEGAVYDMFDSQKHVMERDPNEMKKWMLCQDEGYTNPAAILLVGADSDDRWHVFVEWYHRNKLQDEAVAQAALWCKAPMLAATWMTNDQLDAALREEAKRIVADPRYKSPAQFVERVQTDAVDEAAAGLIAALLARGVPAVGGKGRILDGIHSIQDRLKVQGDGRPRLTVDPRCVNTVNEFESYVWKPEKDVPVDADNHSLGAIRYLEDVMAVPTGAFTSQSASQLDAGTNAPVTSGAGPSAPRPWQTPRPWQR